MGVHEEVEHNEHGRAEHCLHEVELLNLVIVTIALNHPLSEYPDRARQVRMYLVCLSIDEHQVQEENQRHHKRVKSLVQEGSDQTRCSIEGVEQVVECQTHQICEDHLLDKSNVLVLHGVDLHSEDEESRETRYEEDEAHQLLVLERNKVGLSLLHFDVHGRRQVLRILAEVYHDHSVLHFIVLLK
eukprot:CAMPEP_0170482304 /NCGR_PEP_ID=MMETSP0208-20121228/2384_1 /TAXON_ID=197538 /ORGANISM="Strombidium inclinatum, Strain S3" /LENGTH=185 /DNA_ID=CAMNT_0010755131 /DNA_START=1022 /DNA_END=1579 /DNA_ORIENTATION=-